MATILQHLYSTTAGTKPTATGLEPGQIALNLPDKIVFVGDGTSAFTQADGTQGTAPPAGKGFYEVELTGGSDVSTAASVTAAAAEPTTAELNTAFGTNDPQEGDIGIVTAGPHKGIYVHNGTDWVGNPNEQVSLTNVIPVADPAAADTQATALDTNGELTTGDTLVIADSTGLGAQATFGGVARQTPPAGFVEGSPVSYIYGGDTSGWLLLGTPTDIDYLQGLANVNGGTPAAIADADQGGILMRDLSVADESADGAYKLTSIISAGTF